MNAPYIGDCVGGGPFDGLAIDIDQADRVEEGIYLAQSDGIVFKVYAHSVREVMAGGVRVAAYRVLPSTCGGRRLRLVFDPHLFATAPEAS